LLIRVAGRFALVNRKGVTIAPANDWMPDKKSQFKEGDFWNEPRHVLKYAAMMLFLYAVASDNFRYVHTIGHAMTDSGNTGMLDFLPAPYNGNVPERR